MYVSLIKNGKLNIEVLLNATLAGGVAIGSGCDLCQNPAAAMLVGGLAGALSAVGFMILNPII